MMWLWRVLSFTSRTDFVPASYVGLGLSFAFQLTQYLKFAVRMSAMLEAHMNSVERVQHYINEVEPEETFGQDELTPSGGLCCLSSASVISRAQQYQDITKSVSEKGLVVVPDEQWPSKGNIEASNISMAYRDGPLVLKGVSFNFKGTEKVGIAGRTGR